MLFLRFAILPPSFIFHCRAHHWLIVRMASSNTAATTFALEKSLAGNLRFFFTFAHLAGRDLSPLVSFLLLFVEPASLYEVLTSWGILSIAAFWLWMLASRLGFLAIVGLVASAPWWSALLPEDTPALLGAACKAATRLLVEDPQFEAQLAQQAAQTDDLTARLQTSQAENKALEARVQQAEQRAEAPHRWCQFAGKLQDAQIEMMSMALELAKQTEELAQTKSELDESRLLVRDAKGIPVLLETIGNLKSELDAAKELLVQKERRLQEEEKQICEKEQELGELVDELEALRVSEYRARAGAAETARTMVALRANLTIAKAKIASFPTQLAEKEVAVASITAQLAEQEAETALANQEIDELRELVNHGEQVLHKIVVKANDKIHRRNAEVSRLWAFLQVRLAEVNGLRWELGVCVAEAARLKEALEVMQPPPSPSVVAVESEGAVRQPPSDLPTIIFQSPSSEWMREEKPKVDKSLLRAPKRNNRTNLKLFNNNGFMSTPPSSSPSPSPSASPSASSSTDHLAVQLTLSQHFPPPSNEVIPRCVAAPHPPAVGGTMTAPSSADEELEPASRPAHEENILPAPAQDEIMPTPLEPVRNPSAHISLAQDENIISPTPHEPIDSHTSALKGDSKAFWVPARSLSVSLRLRRHPLRSISANAPRRSRLRNQNQNQIASKPVDPTCEADEGSWTVINFD
ncbi:hypothetical protein OH76DRAFT_1143029 [Lentinus brumalis]|uniref:Uncharacterized protein n=1 Tax=Lentinus brumalis TaxID=2498619 RepID=A0A371DME4_9APHY|nr:hypothetical protein OH76DRAFT_1143029 [Polyporus brumalis]